MATRGNVTVLDTLHPLIRLPLIGLFRLFIFALCCGLPVGLVYLLTLINWSFIGPYILVFFAICGVYLFLLWLGSTDL